MIRTALVPLLLAFTFLAAPASADPLNIDLGPIGPWLPHANASIDDGYPQASVGGLTFGPCGCNCPVVGAGVVIEAAGQRVSLLGATAIVVCGLLYSASIDTGALNQSAEPTVTPRVIMYPGGVQVPDAGNVVSITLPPLP